MDAKIRNLKPGQEIEISRYGNTWVTVSRSGNGKVVSFVRHTMNTDHVFKKMNWNQV